MSFEETEYILSTLGYTDIEQTKDYNYNGNVHYRVDGYKQATKDNKKYYLNLVVDYIPWSKPYQISISLALYNENKKFISTFIDSFGPDITIEQYSKGDLEKADKQLLEYFEDYKGE